MEGCRGAKEEGREGLCAHDYSHRYVAKLFGTCRETDPGLLGAF